jgi:hypothetical protein
MQVWAPACGGLVHAVHLIPFPARTNSPHTRFTRCATCLYAHIPTTSTQYAIFRTQGAITGAAVAGMLAADRGMMVPVTVASFVMLGGMANAVMLPGQPTAFIVIDLAGYLPMGWLGWQLAMHLRPVGR